VNEGGYPSLKSPATDRKEEMEVGEESVDLRSYEMNKIVYEFPELEPLEFKNLKRYEPFFDYIQQDIWRMVLSYKYEKYWRLRSTALDEVMRLEVTEGRHFIALMELVAITLCDKHTVNVKKSLHLLERLMGLPNKDLDCDPNYPRFFVEVILGNLIQLMNDTKEEFRKAALDIYKNLPEYSLVYLDTAIKAIIKPDLSRNKRKSNPRLQLCKLSVI
jgi:hypothetical protein